MWSVVDQTSAPPRSARRSTGGGSPHWIKLTAQDESSQRADTAGWIPLAIGLSVVILLWDLLELPQLLSFSPVAFGDPGSNLTISYLVSHGYRPVVDFNYPYGLLAIFANMAWFRVAPLTPVGYQLASVICQTGRGLRDRKSRKGAGVRTASTDFPVHCDRPRSDADVSELRAWSGGCLDLPGRGRASAWSTGKCAGADYGRGLRKTIYGVCLFGVAADADGVGSQPASKGLTGDMVQTDRTCCDCRDIALRPAGNCVWC